MKTFTDDLKYVWQKPNNTLARLIIINVAVFLLVNIPKIFSPIASQEILTYLGLPPFFGEFIIKPWTLLTYYFTHEGFGHIFWNMIMLYWFGMIIQEFLNSSKLLAIYILGGLAGGIGYLLTSNLLPFFSMNAGAYMIGASAGVLAIVVGAATFMPDYRMGLLFIGPVKIKYIAAVAFFLSLVGLRGPNSGGEVAHVSGALLGFFFIMQLKKGNDWSKPVTSTLDWFESFYKAKPKMKVTYTSGNKKRKAAGRKADYSSTVRNGEVDQNVIDEILDKIHTSGYEKLTKEEKQILFKASQKS